MCFFSYICFQLRANALPNSLVLRPALISHRLLLSATCNIRWKDALVFHLLIRLLGEWLSTYFDASHFLKKPICPSIFSRNHFSENLTEMLIFHLTILWSIFSFCWRRKGTSVPCFEFVTSLFVVKSNTLLTNVLCFLSFSNFKMNFFLLMITPHRQSGYSETYC